MTGASKMWSTLIAVFRRQGRRPYTLGITEEQHALRCATLAGDAGEPPELIAACLLHDFGRLLAVTHPEDPVRSHVADHAQLGAAFLARWFEPAVTEPIRLHTEAKRYLSWLEPDYANALPTPSRRSLSAQGGTLTDAEALEFEVQPHFSAAVRVRRYDDLAARQSFPTPPLGAFRLMLEVLARPAPASSSPTRPRIRRSGRPRPRPCLSRGARVFTSMDSSTSIPRPA